MRVFFTSFILLPTFFIHNALLDYSIGGKCHGAYFKICMMICFGYNNEKGDLNEY